MLFFFKKKPFNDNRNTSSTYNFFSFTYTCFITFQDEEGEESWKQKQRGKQGQRQGKESQEKKRGGQKVSSSTTISLLDDLFHTSETQEKAVTIADDWASPEELGGIF